MATETLFRSDFFPGLGWMLTKDLWSELTVKWPKAWVIILSWSLSYIVCLIYLSDLCSIVHDKCFFENWFYFLLFDDMSNNREASLKMFLIMSLDLLFVPFSWNVKRKSVSGTTGFVNLLNGRREHAFDRKFLERRHSERLVSASMSSTFPLLSCNNTFHFFTSFTLVASSTRSISSSLNSTNSLCHLLKETCHTCWR